MMEITSRIKRCLASIRAALPASLSAARDLAAIRNEVVQLTNVVHQLLERHHNALPLPPETLRLHVGTRTTGANFLAQGANSSRRALEVFGQTPSGPVLDWGCGSGRTLRWLWEYPAWREQYRGCDVDGEAIEWLQAHGVGYVQVCSVDPPLPYPEATFAGVFAFSVLTHIHPQRHRDWYHELARVLRPGARAYLTTHGSSLAERIPPEARRRLSESGFAYVEHEGHYKDASVVSEEFTRRALGGILDLQEYVAEGYQNMDAFLVVRPDV